MTRQGQDVLLFIDNVFRFCVGRKCRRFSADTVGPWDISPLADGWAARARITSRGDARSRRCKSSTLPPTFTPTQRRRHVP